MKRRRHKQELRNVTRRIVYGGTSSSSLAQATTVNPTSSNCDTVGDAAVDLEEPNILTSTQQQTPMFATIEMTSYVSSGDGSSTNTTTSHSSQAMLLDQSLPRRTYQPPQLLTSSTSPTTTASMPTAQKTMVVNADTCTGATKRQSVPKVEDGAENSNGNAVDADTTNSPKWECLKDVVGSIELCSLRFDTSLVVTTGNNDYRTIYGGKEDEDEDDDTVVAVTTLSQSAASSPTTPIRTMTPIKSLLLEEDNEEADYDEEAKKAAGGLMT
jgi:hypothetical protein